MSQKLLKNSPTKLVVVTNVISIFGSAIPSIIPVLLLLDPGYLIVLQILRVMQEANGVVGDKRTDVVTHSFLLGVSYSLGMYIALSYCTPVLIKRSID